PLALFEGAAGAAVPQVLLTSTIHAAWSGIGAVLPGPATALAEGVIQSMFVAKLKTIGAALVAVAALGGSATLVGDSFGMGSSALAAPSPDAGASTQVGATHFVGVAGGPAMVLATSEVPLKPASDEGIEELRKLDVTLTRLKAEIVATEAQKEQIRG